MIFRWEISEADCVVIPGAVDSEGYFHFGLRFASGQWTQVREWTIPHWMQLRGGDTTGLKMNQVATGATQQQTAECIDYEGQNN